MKGFSQIGLIVGALVIIIAGGAYYLGRSTSSNLKPSPAPVITSQFPKSSPLQNIQTPQPTVIPTPTPGPDPELTFPSQCTSPSVNPICIVSASRIKIYNNLSDLIRDSELIVVGRVLDSCLDRNSTMKSTYSSQTPYIGHLVIERSLKNTLKLEKIFIWTAYLQEFLNGSGQIYGCDFITLAPNKSYLLFLKKHPNGKFYWHADSPYEIQNSILMRNSKPPSDFEEEIIQLGLDGLSGKISKLSQ